MTADEINERLWFNRTKEELRLKVEVLRDLRKLNDPLYTNAEKLEVAQRLKDNADALLIEIQKAPRFQ